MQPYERLEAWQACHELAVEVYRITMGWPSMERFGLVQQARRAAFSAATNVVEGRARETAREYRHFLNIANGSLAELGYLIRVATELGFHAPDIAARVESQRDRAARLTWRLYAAIRARALRSSIQRPRNPSTPV